MLYCQNSPLYTFCLMFTKIPRKYSIGFSLSVASFPHEADTEKLTKNEYWFQCPNSEFYLETHYLS